MLFTYFQAVDPSRLRHLCGTCYLPSRIGALPIDSLTSECLDIPLVWRQLLAVPMVLVLLHVAGLLFCYRVKLFHVAPGLPQPVKHFAGGTCYFFPRQTSLQCTLPAC